MKRDSQDNKVMIIMFLVLIMIITPVMSSINKYDGLEPYYGNDLTGRYFQYQRFKANINSKYDYYGFMKVDTGWENSYFIEEDYLEKYIREIIVGSILATDETKETFEDIDKFSEKKLDSYLDSIIEAIRLDYKLENEVHKKEIIKIKGEKYAVVQFDVNDKGNYFYFGFTTSKKAERMIMVRTSDSLEENEKEFLDVANSIEFNSKECEDKTNITVNITNGVFSRQEKADDKVSE